MTIKRGEIYYIESGYCTTGSEQRPGRPAVVVSNDKNNEFSPTIEVVYLTTQPKHDLPTHVTIRSTSRESTTLCEQITSVAVERFGDYYGNVTEQEMQHIETALLISLGLGAGIVPNYETPAPSADSSRLAAAEAKCAVLQEMYDALLSKLIKAS